MSEYGIKIKISHVLPLLFPDKTVLDLLKGSFFFFSFFSCLFSFSSCWGLVRILGYLLHIVVGVVPCRKSLTA